QGPMTIIQDPIENVTSTILPPNATCNDSGWTGDQGFDPNAGGCVLNCPGTGDSNGGSGDSAGGGSGGGGGSVDGGGDDEEDDEDFVLPPCDFSLFPGGYSNQP